jgi:phosphate transport system substrate-binding protein
MLLQRRRIAAAALLAWGTRAWGQGASAPSSPKPAGLPDYQRLDKLTGRVAGAGSSTVAAILKSVGEGFEAAQPGVTVELAGAGSGTALAGMLESPTTMGLLSRAITSREREAFSAKYGHAPTEVKIAIDALAIYVFKNNPVKAMSLADLRRAFGRDADAVQRWGALGLADIGAEWADVPIARFGIERGRGAHDLFRELVLQGREFAGEIETEPVSTSVVQGVGTVRGGIGYGSVYFRTARTRVVPIAVKGADGQAVSFEPTADNALSGRYPLARYLYVYVNKPPNAPLEPLQRQFLSYVLSSDGQAVIAKEGLFALDAKVVGESLALLGAATASAK